MRAVIQRVTSSKVYAEGRIKGEIGGGLNILLGVSPSDNEKTAQDFVDKIVNLRVFSDAEGKMNFSILDVKGEILLISQFTLYGDCTKGRRPSFVKAAEPQKANSVYEQVAGMFRKYGIKVATGEFGAHMDVEINNDGPVAIILDSNEV